MLRLPKELDPVPMGFGHSDLGDSSCSPSHHQLFHRETHIPAATPWEAQALPFK